MDELFPKGGPNRAGKYFTGTSYLSVLSEEQVQILMSPSSRAAGISGTFTTHPRAADRSCSAPRAAAGIRHGARRLGSSIPGTW